MMREPDESVWGKSRGLERPYPLVRHLLDSAAMAGYLWDAYLSESQRAHIAAGLGAADDPTRARLLVALCAGLHDVGKVSGFQFCDARGRGQLSEVLVADAGQAEVQRVGHALAGMQVAPVLLTALGFKEDGTGGVSALERVAEVIGGHHGVFGAFEREVTDTAAYQALFGGSRWADERVAHGASVFGLLGGPRGPEVFEASAAVLVTGVVVLADWLVSQEYYLLRRQRGRMDEAEGAFRGVGPPGAGTGPSGGAGAGGVGTEGVRAGVRDRRRPQCAAVLGGGGLGEGTGRARCGACRNSCGDGCAGGWEK